MEKRSVRRGELPQSLVARFDRLERSSRAETLRQALADKAMLSGQLPLHPDWIVGAEDLTMAVWLSLHPAEVTDPWTYRRAPEPAHLNLSAG